MPVNYPNTFIPYPFSGIQSGFVIHPYHVSFLYDELSGVENLLGLNPLNGFASVTARLTGIETGYLNKQTMQVLNPLFLSGNILSGQNGTALQNGFVTAVDWTSFNSRVFRAGDTITGGLTVVGILSGREVYQSGNRVIDSGANIGSGTGIFAYRSGNELQFKSLIPGTSITLDSNGNSITINSTATGGGINYFTGILSGYTYFSQSGVFDIGSGNAPARTIYSNQYATSLVSGNPGGAATSIVINWNLGSSQILNFNPGFSGNVFASFQNPIPGSTYALQTIQNPSGSTNLYFPSSTAWTAGISGAMSISGNAIDLFTFFWNGSKYLSNVASNFR